MADLRKPSRPLSRRSSGNASGKDTRTTVRRSRIPCCSALITTKPLMSGIVTARTSSATLSTRVRTAFSVPSTDESSRSPITARDMAL